MEKGGGGGGRESVRTYSALLIAYSFSEDFGGGDMLIFKSGWSKIWEGVEVWGVVQTKRGRGCFSHASLSYERTLQVCGFVEAELIYVLFMYLFIDVWQENT